MTISYITVTAPILQIKDLSLTQKLILGLVCSLRAGLKMLNPDIGELLRISDSQVSYAINDLDRKGYVKIDNPQSKYRTIYLTENPKVRSALLNGKPESKQGLLHGLTGSTSRKTRNINKR